MKIAPDFYRFSGLIATLGLVSLLVGFVVMLLLPSIQHAAWGIMALGILLLAIAFVIDFRKVKTELPFWIFGKEEVTA